MQSAGDPSICIPRVEQDVTSEQVTAVFERVLGKGTVERVDIVPWRGRAGTGPRRVFVHLHAWPSDAPAARIRERLLAGKEVELVYSDPWIWRCARSRVPKPRMVGGYRAPLRGLAPQLAALARACGPR